jgi:Uma2 family endonuclease
MSAVHSRRWTRQEYDRMIEAGVLTPEDRVELIDGEILAMTPQGSAHATGVSLAQEALRTAFGRDVHIRTQLPLAFGAESEPEPDVAVVAGAVRDYRDAHPQSALLVVEVADATLPYDRDVKGSLYARARVPEYWLVNLAEAVVEVHRDPMVMPQGLFGWQYRTVDRFGPGDSMAPLSFPHASIAVADLLP